MDGTSKDSSLLMYPFSCRTPPLLRGGSRGARGGGASRAARRELFPPSLPAAGQAAPAESGAKEATGEQWGMPGGAGTTAALPRPRRRAGPRSRSFLRPRTPLCRGARAGGLPPRSLPLHVTYGSLPGARPADGRPSLTLEIPQASLPVQRRAAEGMHTVSTLSAAHPQTLPPPARSVLEGEWVCPAGSPPAPLPSLSRGRRCGQAGLSQPSALRQLPPTSCHRPRARPSPACREHYQQEKRQHYRRAPTRALQCWLLPFRGRCCTQ